MRVDSSVGCVAHLNGALPGGCRSPWARPFRVVGTSASSWPWTNPSHLDEGCLRRQSVEGWVVSVATPKEDHMSRYMITARCRV